MAEHVLVVDDDQKILSMMRRGLIFAGYEVALSDDDTERVNAGADTTVFVTVRAGAELADFSVNLRAPIVISGGRGHQVINETDDAPVRAALFPQVEAEAETETAAA